VLFFLSQYLLKKVFAAPKLFEVTLASFLTAVIYLLHLGTVQTFYVHLEPFVVMYGFLPWVLLTLFAWLERPRLRLLFVFFILNFGLSVIGFIPPIFISYVLFVAVILAIYFVSQRKWQSVGRSLQIVSVIAATNLYWLFTVALFTFTQQNYYLQSKLNRLSTDTFILENARYGTLSAVAQLKSFYFDTLDQTHFANSGLTHLLQPWMDHFQHPPVVMIGYLIFCGRSDGLGDFAVATSPFQKSSYYREYLSVKLHLFCGAGNWRARHLPLFANSACDSFFKPSLPHSLH
jgi:hypothetical protein